ncbi:extracellular solute-binding protein [Microbacterium sp. EYE_5]|uniref:sugar ABC transporter substrate-binding protein n=1 Tax=unclassified Microbacterium TaxID=2609290 RepID=UPI0020055D6C|nr:MULTISPECIES: extracellular solute-binding protein [unclassified Microbacterium]MCK6081160.1 extracellular solute-binding protein [Microbacterium sp. EYE_382]MCK6086430.1 extracellular solute-binding protein [Microbacterium sp. EYE_384]MCK6124072.1 extracellular solute-binding protein [Microbacterium sp. EYE_80]MCK6126981.1 extracellular solute-binding protein [Microbacterium sp. EYE_79]MCK6142115.1 extracellular solute-binding protein [Microbacterium sp. EYE_39]
MRKMGIGVAALAAGSLLLAGCASGGGTTTPAPAESEAPIDASGVTLTVWTDENRQPAIEAAAATFEEETGATVELVQKNFEDIRNDFTNQVPTGEGPDITIGAHDWLGSLVQAGVVATVDLGESAANFEKVATDAFTYDGQTYALPYSLETIALIQNTDLVGEDAPATWDDMIAAGSDSDAERPFVINTAGQTGDAYTMYGLQTSFGAPVFVQDESGSYTSEVGMGGDAGNAFATWLGEHGEKGSGEISTTIDYDTNNELFASGKAAYTIQGPWAVETLTAQGANIKVNPIPSAGGETASPFVGVQGFYISAESQNALVAQEFLTKYLATYDAQKALYEADPRIPAWSDLAEEVSSDPVIAGFVASSQNGVPMPNIPEMGSVWDLWNAAQVQIIKGADAEGTWTKMVSDLEGTIG